MRSEGRVHKRGFTLIEVLISLTLLTVVLGAVYSSFFAVQRAADRFDNVSLKYHEARTALDILRREIEGAFIQKPQSKDITKNRTAFLLKDRDIFGKSASVLYLTTFASKGETLKLVSYSVEEKDKELRLLKMDTQAVNLTSIFTGLKRSEVIDGIEGFSIEILFKDKWVRTWDASQTNSLPEMVRVSIEFRDNDRNVKLTEYASPRIGRKI